MVTKWKMIHLASQMDVLAYLQKGHLNMHMFATKMHITTQLLVKYVQLYIYVWY